MPQLADIFEEFTKANAEARLWGRQPDEFTDAADCDVVSRAFMWFLRDRYGIDSTVVGVHATYEGGEDHHFFTVLDECGLAVDWTARQFHNVTDFPLAHDQIPYPLLFAWPGPYPLPGFEVEPLRHQEGEA